MFGNKQSKIRGDQVERSLPAPTGESPNLSTFNSPSVSPLTSHSFSSRILLLPLISPSLSSVLQSQHLLVYTACPQKPANENLHVPLGSSSPSQIPTWRLLLAWPAPPRKGLSGLECSTRVPLTRENLTLHRRSPDAKESPPPVARCSSPPRPVKMAPFARRSLELVTRVKSKRPGAQVPYRVLGARGCRSHAIIMQPTREDSLPTHSLHRPTQASPLPRLPGLLLQRSVVPSWARVRVLLRPM